MKDLRMKKLIFSFNAIWVSAILLSTVSVHGMESSSVKTSSFAKIVSLGSPASADRSADRPDYAQVTLDTEKYNDNECFLIELPSELLPCIQPLMDTIKFFMKLRITCKKFNELLTREKIANRCKEYDLTHKNGTFGILIHQWNYNIKDTIIPISIQILVHAGANSPYLIQRALIQAIYRDNEELIITLLKHGANPNETVGYNSKHPIFFEAMTIKTAQILIDNDANLHATDMYKLNVLHHLLFYPKSLELMKFYLQHNADATHLAFNNKCMLHRLGGMIFMGYPQDRNVENILEKGKFLLTVIPHMINALNNDGKTPLDVAQYEFDEEIKTINKSCYTKNKPEHKEVASKDFEKIVELFRSYGGLTAQELAQKEKQSQLEHT